MAQTTTHPKSAPHEIRANILYTDHGDRPYWNIKEMAQELNSNDDISINIDGKTWNVSIKSQSSGLDPRPSDDVDTLYEYRVYCSAGDEQKLPLLIQPRLDWGKNNCPQPIPDDLGPATNVRVETATNLEPNDIEALIPRVFEKVTDYIDTSWPHGYLTGTPHPYSSITQYERYYRINRKESKLLVSTDGIFERLSELLSRTKGTKIVHTADNSEIIGHNHQVRLDHSAANKLLDGPQHGKQFKYYHPKHPRKRDSGDPLYHPKIGCLFKKKWNNNGSVPWNDHDDLSHELEENLINLLYWEDIPIRCGSPFVSDWHFSPTPSERSITIAEDPTPRISRHQDDSIIAALSELTERDRKIIKTVASASDGGIHVKDIESKTDRSSSTIYRGLDNLNELLQNKNGIVQFRSKKIQRRIHSILDSSTSSNPQTQICADTLGDKASRIQETTNAWTRWRLNYDVDIDDNDDKLEIRIRTVMDKIKSKNCEFAPEVVNKGKSAWMKMGHDPKRFHNAEVKYDTSSGTKKTTVKSLLRHNR
jgi:hypothetical protein